MEAVSLLDNSTLSSIILWEVQVPYFPSHEVQLASLQ